MPLNTEVFLIKIIWGIMAHILGTFWICSFFCQITFLGFGMDVYMANISCYVCVKILWKNLEHQYFFNFLNKTWFCWEPKHHQLCWISWLSWVKILRPSDQMAASIQFYQFLAKILPQCTLTQLVKNCF